MDLTQLVYVVEHNAVVALLVLLLYALHKGWIVPMHVYEADRKRYDAAYRALYAVKTVAAAVDPRRLLRQWQREDLADWDRRFARWKRWGV